VVKCVLLAGGLGVRMRPLTYTIPKPLLPVGERPILEEIVRSLEGFGLRDLVIAVGYRADLIETYFRDGSQLGVHIDYCRESEPLGTAGPLALVREQFAATADPDDPVFVMNGDLLTELDVPALVDFHERGGQEITVVTRDHEHRNPYGVIDLDGDRITRIVEKPAVTEKVNAGIYVLRWSVLDLVPEGAPYQMPDLVNSAIAKGYQVVSYPFVGSWLAIDRVEQLMDSASMVGRQSS